MNDQETRASKRNLAAIYLRVSTDEQTTANQRPALARLAAARGLKLGHDYVEAESTRKRRPEFERMVQDARTRAFDVLLIWSLDRLGRDTLSNMLTIAELDRLGVRVISSQEPWLDTTGPTRTLLVAIFSWVAEQERNTRSERTRAGLERVRREGSKSGRPIGRPRRLDGATLARVFDLRAAGRSVRSIAMALRVPRPTVQRALAAQDHPASAPIAKCRKRNHSLRPRPQKSRPCR